MEDKVSPTGRGKNLKNEIGRVPQIEKMSDKMGCKEIGKTLSIHPDGSVHLCCGHASFDTYSLCVGNIKDKTLRQMVSEARKNILFWWIHMHGTMNILNDVGSNFRPSTICEACEEIFMGSKGKVLNYIQNNKEKILMNDILLSKDLVKGANAILEKNTASPIHSGE